jgi:hypothetical protein
MTDEDKVRVAAAMRELYELLDGDLLERYVDPLADDLCKARVINQECEPMTAEREVHES